MNIGGGTKGLGGYPIWNPHGLCIIVLVNLSSKSSILIPSFPNFNPNILSLAPGVWGIDIDRIRVRTRARKRACDKMILGNFFPICENNLRSKSIPKTSKKINLPPKSCKPSFSVSSSRFFAIILKSKWRDFCYLLSANLSLWMSSSPTLWDIYSSARTFTFTWIMHNVVHDIGSDWIGPFPRGVGMTFRNC